MNEYSKLLEERDEEINRLHEQINSLKEIKTSLETQIDSNQTKIEDLEFQIEEQKLGFLGTADEEPSADLKRTVSNQEEENLVLKQLQLQQEICKNHLEESKFLKEQIESLNKELEKHRKEESLFAKEKQELKKHCEDTVNELNAAKQEANENIRLKDQIKQLELAMKKQHDEADERKKNDQALIGQLKTDLSSSNDKFHQNESQRSELEFLYEESKVKIGELNSKIEEKSIELTNLKIKLDAEGETVTEFVLEEQKVLVQELEVKLAALSAAKAEELSALEKQLELLKESNSKLESEKSLYLETQKVLTTEFETKLTAATTTKAEELDALQKEIEALKEAISNLGKEKVAMESQNTEKISQMVFNLKI